MKYFKVINTVKKYPLFSIVKMVFTFLSLFFVISSAFPQVIATLGQTQPLSSFLKGIEFGNNTMSVNNKTNILLENPTLKTVGLIPGVVEKQATQNPLLSQPIYLVGDDPLSQKWLKEYSEQLKKLHAVGFIVNTDNSSSLAELEQQFAITFIPIEGSAFKERFGLTHYPVLISQQVIEQ